MPGRKPVGRRLIGLLVLFVAAAGLFLYWPLVKPKGPPPENEQPVDVVLVGGGIMSMTLATYLNELQPDWKMQLFEQEDQVANESSNGWNNAGTGHSAFAELNYTPELPDGSIETKRAVDIAEQFEVSRQFWAHQVRAGRLPQPSEFINPTPHMSFVWGDDNIAYLRKRHAALSKLPLFYGMQYSEDFEQIRKWAPLMIQGRDPKQRVAATWMPLGTDVNFGVITRNLAAALQKQPNFSLQLKHRVTALNQNADHTWNVTVKDLASGKERTVRTRFVFIGAGGMAVKMLQLSGIPESKNYAGFPVGGQFLAFETPNVTDHHLVKAYGKAETGSPPMSVPHLDARRLDGKRVVLFGPFALYSTKYLKHGSWFDLFSSVTHDNVLQMLTTGAENLDLVQYLVKQAMLNDADRQKELEKYFPEARRGDWKLITAGQRVQIIKKDPVKGAVLQFGTEIVTDEHRSLAALLGASPGASTSPPIMLKLLAKAFPEKMAGDWKERIKTIVPSWGRQLNDSAAITNQIRGMTAQALQLPYLTVPDDPSRVPPPAAGTDTTAHPAPARTSPGKSSPAPTRSRNLETEMQAL